MNINFKITKLREAMKAKDLSAYIIPSTDPHISEYVPEHWTSRMWISGFTGSAGTIVVTLDEAGLWTDSRYFLQGAEQLKGSEIKLHKMGMPGVDDYPDWLNKVLNENVKVGFDGKVMPVAITKSLQKTFELKKINIVPEYDLISEIWTENRPEIPRNELFVWDEKYAGRSAKDKISEIQSKMKEMAASYHLVCTLDDIAWLFNIRGNDVPFNPVVVAYALITESNATLYIFGEKVPANAKDKLNAMGVEIKDYNEIFNDLKAIESGKNILIDPNKSNTWLYKAIPDNVKIIEKMNISTLLKSVKNDTEINGMKSALRRDAVAMTKFIHWLENNIGKEKITELSAAKKLYDFRKEIDLFVGESFNTISGYAGHGAIVHYAVTSETDIEIGKDTFYLIDSGGQYYDGTTDITRTLHFGEPTDEEKKDYTLVLKGHIDLAMAKYPQGTRGAQLDAIARKPLWDNGLHYSHGTGHGIGCFLNVHEGPQNIRLEENPTKLQPGMITSNEPGVYKADKHGIRIENLVLTVEDSETEFGKFYNFETLTLCFIETKTIDKSLLTDDEINWLNVYHQKVYDEVSPLLDDEMKKYLAEKTKKI
jgi:Xaa-Pro aminopeptidase